LISLLTKENVYTFNFFPHEPEANSSKMHLAVNPEEVTNLAEVQIQEKTRNKAYTPEREYQRSETF